MPHEVLKRLHWTTGDADGWGAAEWNFWAGKMIWQLVIESLCKQ